MGMGCTHRIYLDGVPAADLRSGQAVTLYADPGEHVLSAIATALCDGSSEISMAILTGQTKTFRSGADGNGNIRLQPTAF